MRAKQSAELVLFWIWADLWPRLSRLTALECARIVMAVPHGAMLFDFDSDSETVWYVHAH